MRFIGHALLLVVTLLLGPPALVLALLRPGWRAGLRERLMPGKRRSDRPVWVHVASVGEAAAARALIDALAEAGAPLQLTAQTLGGRDRLSADHPRYAVRLAPIDHPWLVARVVARLQPRALVLIETEIWPGLVAAAHRRGVPTVVVSGRLSERAHRIQHELDPLFRSTFEKLAVVGARTEADAKRFESLGVAARRVRVTGDLKWAKTPERGAAAPEITGWMSRHPTVVLGSTHPDEDRAFMEAIEALRARGRDVQWLWAPRHLADVGPLLDRLATAGVSAVRRTALEGGGRETADVLVLDSLGELASIWSHGQLAVVGGTFGDTGGHDLLEPLHVGRPVLFGPSVHGVEATAEALLEADAAVQVEGGEALGRAVARLLDEPRERAELVAHGTTLLEAGRTSLDANLELVKQAAGGQWRPAPSGLQRALDSTRAPAGLYARGGPAASWSARAVLGAASLLYGLGARIDRATARFGLRRPSKLPCAVVSVGGWLAGGSAKTPVAIWLAAALRERGHRVAVLTRGHGVSLGGRVVIASHGDGPCEPASRVGDEAVVIARACPGVPVLAARDRLRAGRAAVLEFGCEVLVVDDGFQHGALHRDVDLVCLDGEIGLGNGRVLPAGPLREPASAWRHADALIVTDGPLRDEDERRVEERAPGLQRFTAQRRVVGWRDLRSGELHAAQALDGREVSLIAGLADPASFRRLAEQCGVGIGAACIRPDHHAWARRDLRVLSAGPATWITTTKDAAKLDQLDVPRGVDVFVLELEWRPAQLPSLATYVEERCGLGRVQAVPSDSAKPAPSRVSASR